MMGLFKKDSPAEKKLKKLTGGMILSNSFMKTLKENGLSIDDGIKIKNQLKSEIKNGEVGELDVVLRLNQLIKEYSSNATPSLKNCPNCGESQQMSNTFCISCGHKFSSDSKTCPICNRQQDFQNNICIYCGYDFSKKRVKPKRKTCPNCNMQVFEKTQSCPNCYYDFKRGRVIAKYKKCPNCKTKILKNSKTCPECGYDFETGRVINPFIDRIDFKNRVMFLRNYDFNLKYCPDCNAKLLKTDAFCFSCGTDVSPKPSAEPDIPSETSELSSLEELYSKTISSAYSPTFKVAYVLYLNEMRKNPSKEFPINLAKKFSTTQAKLKKQALDDGFIEPAPAISEARNFKVSDLKEILKSHGLKVSGKKDELIERLAENLSEDELKKYFKTKNYQISQKGVEFLENNRPTLYIVENEDISNVISPHEILRVFEDKAYECDEIYDVLAKYLIGVLDEKVASESWEYFRDYSNAIAQVRQDKRELESALINRIKVFLFDINNYSPSLNRPNPRKTRLRKKDVAKLNGLLQELTLPVDELKELFEIAYSGTQFKTVITSPDSLIYLLKVFGGEDLDEISRGINECYSNPY